MQEFYWSFIIQAKACSGSAFRKLTTILQGWEFAHSLLRSNRSNQMSDCERIAQVAHVKRATVSESLSSLMTNEHSWVICLGRSRKMSKWANRSFFLSESLIRSFAHKKRAIRSKFCWLKSYFWYVFVLFFKRAICSFLLFNERCERITHSLIFSQKTSDSRRKPMS